METTLISFADDSTPTEILGAADFVDPATEAMLTEPVKRLLGKMREGQLYDAGPDWHESKVETQAKVFTEEPHQPSSEAATDVMDRDGETEEDLGVEIKGKSLTQVSVLTDKARTEYARRSAERGSRIFDFGTEFTKGAIAAARNDYETRRKELLRHLAATRGGDGYVPSSLVVEEAKKMAGTLFSQRLIASGEYEATKISDDRTGTVLDRIVPVEKIKLRQYLAGSLSKWWNKKPGDGPSGEAPDKRYVVTIGIPEAATAIYGPGLLFPPAGIAVAGALACNKIAEKILDSGSGNRRSNIFNLRYSLESAIDQAAEARKINELGRITNNFIDAQTAGEIPKNKRRAAIRLGATAVGGVVGGIGGLLLN